MRTTLAIVLALVLTGAQNWRAFSYENGQWWLCQDQYGIQLVHQPSGDAYGYGTNWTISEVEERHGLDRRTRRNAGSGSGDCPR